MIKISHHPSPEELTEPRKVNEASKKARRSRSDYIQLVLASYILSRVLDIIEHKFPTVPHRQTWKPPSPQSLEAAIDYIKQNLARKKMPELELNIESM